MIFTRGLKESVLNMYRFLFIALLSLQIFNSQGKDITSAENCVQARNETVKILSPYIKSCATNQAICFHYSAGLHVLECEST